MISEVGLQLSISLPVSPTPLIFFSVLSNLKKKKLIKDIMAAGNTRFVVLTKSPSNNSSGKNKIK